MHTMLTLVGERRTMAATRIMLHPRFEDELAKRDIGMNEMVKLAGIGHATFYALKNPETQPNRRGGMHRTTAWKLVNAFAERTGIDPEAAWDMLLVEVEQPPQRRRRAAS